MNTQNIDRLSSDLNAFKDEARGGIAAAAAMNSFVRGHMDPGDSSVGVGLGHFAGETAIGVDFTHRVKGSDGQGRTHWTVGIGTNGDEVVYKAGVGWIFKAKK